MTGSAAAFLAAFGVSVLVGTPLIRALRRMGARQTVSEDAPARHIEKQGTPTMGGLMILAGLTVPVLVALAQRTDWGSSLGLLALTLSFGLIGFVDDYRSATRGRNLGLKAREKLALQCVGALAFVLWMRATAVPGRTTVLLDRDLGDWYYALGAVYIVGLSNAVNLMDGLDGLAAGVTALIAVALAGMVRGSDVYGWLPVFAGALAGGTTGLLWYNCHPAQVFMGDTGSLALGAALAGLAMLGKAEEPAQVCSAVPWAETLSVMIQVGVFKLRRRRHGLDYAKAHRVFRRTPLHHHFEELGWKETRIVQRFWLVTAVAVAVALAALG